MGVIFFTLLAVALGYGVGSKTRKAKKHPGGNQMRQDTVSFVGHREKMDSQDGWGSVSPDSPQEKRKECPEDMKSCGKDSVVEESPAVDNKEEGSAPVFSLREAVIAQTVLERKYN